MPVVLSRLEFAQKQLGADKPLQFFELEQQEAIQNILLANGVFPVTISNFVRAYKLIHQGCVQRGISLKFSNPNSN